MIRFLLEKEFKQLVRNPFLPKLILVFPVIMMILIPLAANMEVKNLNVSVVDNDHSTMSKRLISKIEGVSNFTLNEITYSYSKALSTVESGASDAIVVIPVDFESDIENRRVPKVSVVSNAVNATKGGIGSSYLNSVIGDFLLSGTEYSRQNRVTIVDRYRYNSGMDYKVFMVPALMVMLITMICGFLPALNIVSEKEAGTIEQINVTPVSKGVFILAKLVPYWVTGLIVLTICVLFAIIVYGLVPAGGYLMFYIASGIFILVVSGVGLVISNSSSTMQQAMFVMYFFMLIFILMSGLFTPVESMPQWAKTIAMANPMKYFVEIMRMIYLKGSHFAELLSRMAVLVGFAILFNVWAVMSYRKSS